MTDFTAPQTLGFLITSPTFTFNLYFAGALILFYQMYVSGTEALNSGLLPINTEEVSMTMVWFLIFVLCLLWPVWMVTGVILEIIQLFNSTEQ